MARGARQRDKKEPAAVPRRRHRPEDGPALAVARLEDIDAHDDRAQPTARRSSSIAAADAAAVDRGGWAPTHQGRVPVLVFADGDRGMVSSSTRSSTLSTSRLRSSWSSERPGLIGSAVIGGKATDVVDVAWYLTQAFDDWFAQVGTERSAKDRGGRILLVDDSAFFRNSSSRC